jgi:hypothetical protein
LGLYRPAQSPRPTHALDAFLGLVAEAAVQPRPTAWDVRWEPAERVETGDVVLARYQTPSEEPAPEQTHRICLMGGGEVVLELRHLYRREDWRKAKPFEYGDPPGSGKMRAAWSVPRIRRRA